MVCVLALGACDTRHGIRHPVASGFDPAAHRAWLVYPDGIGPIKVGMMVRQVSTLVGDTITRMPPEQAVEGNCDYYESHHLPAGVELMTFGDTVVRVDITDSPVRATVQTAEGVGIGASEERVLTAYHERVTVHPSPYGADTDHDLWVTTPGDRAHGMLFEVFNGHVASFRVGRWDAVQMIEGCL